MNVLHVVYHYNITCKLRLRRRRWPPARQEPKTELKYDWKCNLDTCFWAWLSLVSRTGVAINPKLVPGDGLGTSKSTFYTCFTIRTRHLGCQHRCFTRVLPSELIIWNVKINVLHVLYNQNSPSETSKSTFHTCSTIKNDRWDVKINVLHVFYH